MDFKNKQRIKRARMSLFLLPLAIATSLVFGQGPAERHRTYISLEYVKTTDQTYLQASVTARVEGVRGRTRVENVEILFHHLLGTGKNIIGSAITDVDGVAKFVIKEPGALGLNDEGAYVFEAVFVGNDEYNDISDQIEILPAALEISFEEVDSIRYIVVSAFQLTLNGEQVPIEEDVMVYVPRQFSKLTIGEIELDEGTGKVEFPVTLPGDSVGNLTITASIEESRNYGTLEVQAVKDWGMVREPVVVEQRRGLGDTDAPLWMVYTLITLMSAVWFHYLYLLYMLYVIKHKGKKKHLIV